MTLTPSIFENMAPQSKIDYTFIFENMTLTPSILENMTPPLKIIYAFKTLRLRSYPYRI